MDLIEIRRKNAIQKFEDQFEIIFRISEEIQRQKSAYIANKQDSKMNVISMNGILDSINDALSALDSIVVQTSSQRKQKAKFKTRLVQIKQTYYELPLSDEIDQKESFIQTYNEFISDILDWLYKM